MKQEHSPGFIVERSGSAGDLKCTSCGKMIAKDKAYYFGKEQILCDDCFEAETEAPQKCPSCGTLIRYDHESVGLLLTPKGSTPDEKKNALDTLVIVCPKCHVLFFDDFHYKLLEGLKQKG